MNVNFNPPSSAVQSLLDENFPNSESEHLVKPYNRFSEGIVFSAKLRALDSSELSILDSLMNGKAQILINFRQCRANEHASSILRCSIQILKYGLIGSLAVVASLFWLHIPIFIPVLITGALMYDQCKSIIETFQDPQNENTAIASLKARREFLLGEIRDYQIRSEKERLGLYAMGIAL